MIAESKNEIEWEDDIEDISEKTEGSNEEMTNRKNI